jgi:hypothetical protein
MRSQGRESGRTKTSRDSRLKRGCALSSILGYIPTSGCPAIKVRSVPTNNNRSRPLTLRPAAPLAPIATGHLQVIVALCVRLSTWRDRYISLLGVGSHFPAIPPRSSPVSHRPTSFFHLLTRVDSLLCPLHIRPSTSSPLLCPAPRGH